MKHSNQVKTVVDTFYSRIPQQRPDEAMRDSKLREGQRGVMEAIQKAIREGQIANASELRVIAQKGRERARVQYNVSVSNGYYLAANKYQGAEMAWMTLGSMNAWRG